MNAYSAYSDPLYVHSLREFGRPRELARSGGWILERPIPGTSYTDATGCYPLFACRDWSKLPEDLAEVGREVVSLALVVDPFSGVSPEYLQRHFDVVKPFKTHYIADLTQPPETFVGSMQRRYARKSLEKMEVEICHHPARYAAEWVRLYDNLIRRYDIRGVSAFSPECFANQLQVNGMMLFMGKQEGQPVSASLVLKAGRKAYSHLAASSDRGYRIRAAYGVHWTILQYGREHGITHVDFGGTAGPKDDPESGLAQFKKGWANNQRIAYFCGRVFNRQAYELLCDQYRSVYTGYFPAYREALTSQRPAPARQSPT